MQQPKSVISPWKYLLKIIKEVHMIDFIYILILFVLLGLAATLFLNKTNHKDYDLEDILKQQEELKSMLECLSNEYSCSDSKFYNENLFLKHQNETLTAENTELKNIILKLSYENQNNNMQL